MDPNSVFLIEWPEILGNNITPNKKISIEIMENEDRKITIETYTNC
jgi:tRNA A37 threonylcarbamoyladenosine biosynthesis protein TsaE